MNPQILKQIVNAIRSRMAGAYSQENIARYGRRPTDKDTMRFPAAQDYQWLERLIASGKANDAVERHPAGVDIGTILRTLRGR